MIATAVSHDGLQSFVIIGGRDSGKTTFARKILEGLLSHSSNRALVLTDSYRNNGADYGVMDIFVHGNVSTDLLDSAMHDQKQLVHRLGSQALLPVIIDCDHMDTFAAKSI